MAAPLPVSAVSVGGRGYSSSGHSQTDAALPVMCPVVVEPEPSAEALGVEVVVEEGEEQGKCRRPTGAADTCLTSDFKESSLWHRLKEQQ